MSIPQPTVFVVDDDTSFLRSLARLLRASGFDVATYPSATAFLAQLPENASGCVIVDLQMPGMSGIDLQDALQNTPNPLPLIFLSGQGDIPVSVRAMRHGAEDFLTKHAPQEALLDAVRRALVRHAREREQRERQQAVRARFEALTEREHEVLHLVLRGQLNKQIANHLGIHERTVKLHRTAITTKVGVPSVAELTRLAQEAGIL